MRTLMRDLGAEARQRHDALIEEAARVRLVALAKSPASEVVPVTPAVTGRRVGSADVAVVRARGAPVSGRDAGGSGLRRPAREGRSQRRNMRVPLRTR